MSNSIIPQSNLDNFLSFLEREGRIEITEDGIDIFATQSEMAEYFGVTQQAVSLHVNNYEKEAPDNFKDLYKESLYKSHRGRPVRYYNSDILIYVGYRVRSTEKTLAFRKAIASMFRSHISQRMAELQNKLDNSQQVNRWLAGEQGAGKHLSSTLPRRDQDGDE